jgi:hypothetical protein
VYVKEPFWKLCNPMDDREFVGADVEEYGKDGTI